MLSVVDWRHYDRDNAPYCSHFCEENVLMLGQQLIDVCKSDGSSVYAMFISSDDKYTPLWRQRLGQESQGGFVAWDYHVVLLIKSENGADDLIYDADSTLPYPCPLLLYINETFQWKNSDIQASLRRAHIEQYAISLVLFHLSIFLICCCCD